MSDGKTLSGRKAWIISDGKAGHESQCLGVAEALGVDVGFRHIHPGRLFSLLAPYVPVPNSEKFATEASVFHPPWPDIALSAGRLTAPYMRALKQHAGSKTYTVILLDPKVSASAADLFWVPAHDGRRGKNVITTLTPPHRFSPALLATLRQKPPRFPLPADERLKVAVLLGGPSRTYAYRPEDIARLAAILRRFAAEGHYLLVTPSRRTPQALCHVVEEIARDGNGFVWNGQGPNPLAEFYAFADVFIAPGDSINMTGEPCVTGRPVHVFHPSGGSPKFVRFHKALEDHGATRRLQPETDIRELWSYAPLFASEAIADEIVRRWRQLNEDSPIVQSRR